MILVEATQRLEASGESSGDGEDFPIPNTGESGPWLLISIGNFDFFESEGRLINKTS